MNTQRLLNLNCLLSLLAVVFALISQHFFDMRPCAWCSFQRFIYLCLAAVCLVSFFTPIRVIRRFWALLSLGISVAGISAAWFQYSVAQNLFSCDMTFADRFMHQISGLDTAVPWLFGIYASCMDAKVSIWGIDYALWSLFLFSLLAFISLIALFIRDQKKNVQED
ncbi:disulfide bond formation protein B [Basilea psittacipulmonis]|uniref:Disulfide bond formation protein DsbB n=1 Tax=Basilea psittacipulmonis DSM 24701 TaxID=1072685 RepID=A0A077DDD6_9BURK|nr:disulfide bond formation protein B [Basilea psittacipulmonis]AIL32624.1 hypothetical protein IX83_04275 [Basilea psittacipulmonis DSM 24701]